jgi:hypothetical protein
MDQAALPTVAAPTAAAHLARASLEQARQAQAAAQLAGADVPMLLEDLLPLEDLHDPFLELDHVELGGGSAAAAADLPAAPQHLSLHQMHAAAVALGIDPSDPANLFSPTTTGFFGIPAYAEPDSPAAAAFNNSAGALLARQGSTPRVPGLPLHPGSGFSVAQLWAAASSSANDAHGLPPAIAAAQQRAVQQMQAQAQAAQPQPVQQPTVQPQQLQPQPVQPLPVAPMPKLEVKACSSGPGGSHVSHGSADSGAVAATTTTTGTAPQYSAMQQCAVSDSSSGGAGAQMALWLAAWGVFVPRCSMLCLPSAGYPACA